LGVNVTPLLLKQSSRKLNPCLRKSRRLRGAPPPNEHPSRMLKKRVHVPRAHAPTAANAPPPRSALRATIVHRVQRPVDVLPMATVQPVQHALTVSVPPPASAPRARSMTVPQRGIALPVVSVPTANVLPMAIAQPVQHAPTVNVPPPASAHRAPVVLIQTDLAQTDLVQTALPPTGQLSIAHPRTAEVVTSAPLESDPVVRRARSMTVPALASVLRARLFRTSFTTRLLPFR